jgi:hypothetical protein
MKISHENVLGLKELMFRTWEDLRDVEASVQGEGRIHLKEVTFEINLVAVESESAKGGFDLKLLTVGGNAASEMRQVHKVIVKAEASSDVPVMIGESPGERPE